jgi:hypothetical protein
MSEQVMSQEKEAAQEGALSRQQVAMAISVLLFVVFFLWGGIAGLIELSQRKSKE